MMARAKGWGASGLNAETVVHAVRTAVAATVSLVIARMVRMPEAYWAAITTLIVMQSTLGAALTVSWKRLVGTALGAATAALVSTFFRPSAWLFGAMVLALGLISAALRLDRTAYRFASITLAIVLLIPHTRPAWTVATHRFVEVSVGIVVALAITALWPEPEPGSAK